MRYFIGLILTLLLTSCEESNQIKSIIITPEGEVDQKQNETTLKLSVKILHAQGAVISVPTIDLTDVFNTTDAVPVVREVSLKNDIMPVLKAKCQKCHRRSVSRDPPKGLVLTSHRDIMQGRVLDPGWGDSSLIVLLTRRDDIFPKMPPFGPRLTPAEVQMLVDWIDAGAKNN